MKLKVKMKSSECRCEKCDTKVSRVDKFCKNCGNSLSNEENDTLLCGIGGVDDFE